MRRQGLAAVLPAALLAAVLAAVLTAGCASSLDVDASPTPGGGAGETPSSATTPVPDTTPTPAPDGPTYAELVETAGPIAHWTLDDTTGTVAADAGPNGFDGTYAGGVTLGEDPAVDDGGSSVRLDGTTGHVYVADADSPAGEALAPADAVSIELWFRAARLPTGEEVQDLARWRWYGWSIRIIDGRISADVWENLATEPGVNDPRQILLTGPQLEPDRWYHAVLTRNASSARLYLDGERVAEAASSGPLFAPLVDPATDPDGRGGGVGFGRDADIDGQYFNGWLDEVAVYPFALSAEEIAAHAAHAVTDG